MKTKKWWKGKKKLLKGWESIQVKKKTKQINAME